MGSRILQPSVIMPHAQWSDQAKRLFTRAADSSDIQHLSAIPSGTRGRIFRITTDYNTHWSCSSFVQLDIESSKSSKSFESPLRRKLLFLFKVFPPSLVPPQVPQPVEDHHLRERSLGFGCVSVSTTSSSGSAPITLDHHRHAGE